MTCPIEFKQPAPFFAASLLTDAHRNMVTEKVGTVWGASESGKRKTMKFMKQMRRYQYTQDLAAGDLLSAFGVAILLIAASIYLNLWRRKTLAELTPETLTAPLWKTISTLSTPST